MCEGPQPRAAVKQSSESSARARGSDTFIPSIPIIFTARYVGRHTIQTPASLAESRLHCSGESGSTARGSRRCVYTVACRAGESRVKQVL